MKMYIINAIGEKESFSQKKVFHSAKRAGASDEAARMITSIIAKEVYSGIKTSEIFSKIKKLLKKESPAVALKFNIKEGMRKLGPTGFPFEKFIGRILSALGYDIKINQFLRGRCVRDYEIDFVAIKGNELYVGECKYRQYFGDRVHSQDALANYARFLDISSGGYFKADKYKGLTLKTMLVTNTKLTGRALDYCRCAGVDLLGWNYPKNEGLGQVIDREKLYPITILPALKTNLKDVLVQEQMMLAKDLLLLDAVRFAKKHKLPERDVQALINQADVLLK